MDYKRERIMASLKRECITLEDLQKCLKMDAVELDKRIDEMNWKSIHLLKMRKLFCLPFTNIEKLFVNPEPEDALTYNGCVYPMESVDYTKIVELDNGMKVSVRTRIDFEPVEK